MRNIFAGIFLSLLLILSKNVSADLDDFAAPSGSVVTNADYIFTGENTTDYSSNAVAADGDVDGDGKKDVLINAWSNDDGGAGSGKIYLFLGSNLSTTGSLSLADADYMFEGTAGDIAGYSLAFAGDVNADGLDDILIGAYGNNDIGTDSGKTYLVLGSSLGAPGTTINLDTSSDYYFVGDASGDHSGGSVSGAGDVDGDGRDDILIAASNANHGATALCGEVYLILASSLGSSGTSYDLGNSDYIFYGEAVGDYLSKVTGKGDVDADGRGDFLVGAWGNDDGGSLAGKAYVILGASLPTPGTYEISGAADYEFIGETSDEHIGSYLSFAGDVNGDGMDDILLGTVQNDENGTDAGAAYLVLSSSLSGLGTSINLSSADYQFYGESANDHCGPVSFAGDVDEDGLSDILIGAYSNSDNGSAAGQAYLVLASSLGASGSRSLAGNADYYFFGEDISNFAGISLSGGDVDADGLSDILIGAYNYDSSRGRSYLIFAVNECEPEDEIYVDTYLGTSAGPGGPECPYDTIQGGIDAAVASGKTRVIVRGGFYYEDVVLESGIELIGELRWGFWPAFIVNTSGASYLVEGANEAALQNFILYEGGVHLDGVNGMTVQENIVHNQYNTFFYDMLFENGASDNIIKNNIFYKHHFSGFAIYDDVIGFYLEDYTEDNEFRNNIIDTITYPTTTGKRYGFYTAGTNVTATIDYNKTPLNNYGVTMGTGNVVLSQLPKFTNPMPYGFNYTLQTSSACINAGDSSASYNDPDGTRNDMGAFGGPDYMDFRS